MLSRWVPKDRIVKQAVAALLASILSLGVAGGLEAWDDHHNRRAGAGRNMVGEAVWQYGATSPEAAAAVTQLGESTHPKDVVALLDPTTGKAISAWPADMVGKRPDEMLLPGGVKLPAINKLLYRQSFRLRAPDGRTDRDVQVTPFYPWSFSREEQNRQQMRDHMRLLQDEMRSLVQGPGHQPVPQSMGAPAAVMKPEAVLLIAAPPEPVHVLRVLSGFFTGLAAVAFVVYWLSVAWWAFADARRRGSSRAFAWGALTLLTNLVGTAVYLVARREERQCGTCGATVERNFNHCPHCGSTLKRLCPQCGGQMRDDWTHCASCGSPYSPSPVAATD